MTCGIFKCNNHVTTLGSFLHTLFHLVHAFLFQRRVKPSGGKIPSGQQHGDILQALCLDVWETEQAAKTPRKKPEVISVVGTCASGPATPVASQGLAGGEAAAGRAPLAGVDPNTLLGRAARVSQGEDEAAAPMPNYWVPSFMLTWVFWGPLSETPDGDFALESSSGPDGCDAGEEGGGCDEDRKPSLIGSKEGIKTLAPMGIGLSREKRKALEREEKARNKKENNRDTMFEKMWKDNNDQVAKVMDTLKILHDDMHGNRRAEEHRESLALRQEALRNLKEELEIARDEGDEDEIRAITKRRKKLLRTPPTSARRDFNIVNGVCVGETAGSGARGFDGANGAGVIGASSDGVVGGGSGTDMDGVVISGMEEDLVPASGGGGGGVGGSGTDVDGADGGAVYGNGAMGAGVGGSEFGGRGTGVDEAGGGDGYGNGAVGAGAGARGVGSSGTGANGLGGGDGDGTKNTVGAGIGGGEVGGIGTKNNDAAGGEGGRNGVVDAGVGGGGEEWPMVTGTKGAGSGGSASGTNGDKGKGVEDVNSDEEEDLSDAIFETFGVRTLSEVASGAAKKSESESVIDVEM